MNWTSLELYSILHTLAFFLFAGHILKVKKTPTSTLAWLFIVMIQPFLGLMMYGMFGTRKIAITNKPYPASNFSGVNIHDPLQKFLATTGTTKASYNPEIRILTCGEEAYANLINSIEEARESVYLQTFIFSNDEVGRDVLKALTKKAAEGLDVRILMDSLGAVTLGHPSFKEFKLHGGKVVNFMPFLRRPMRGRFNLRNHRKIVLFDHKKAIMGGMNIAKEYLGPTSEPSRWVDLAVVIRGPILEDLQRTFYNDWHFTSGETLNFKAYAPEPIPSPPNTQLVISGPDQETDTIYDWLLGSIHTAKKRIWITTPYFIPDESLAKALELAAKKGVDVKLIVPKKSNHILADLGRMTYISQVEKAGVQVLYYPKMIHAKLTIIDDSYGFMGSANFDIRSLLLNYEVGLILYTKDEVLKLEKWCQGLCAVSSQEKKSYSNLDAIIGGLARLFSPLI